FWSAHCRGRLLPRELCAGPIGDGQRSVVRTGGCRAVTGDPGGGDGVVTTTVYVPRDSAARSVGADEIASELQRVASDSIRLVRNGSRGALWLEPLVEVETHRGRVG